MTPPTGRAVSEVLEELAVRCEAATGADRELFRDAFDALFPRPAPIRKPGFEMIGDGLGPYTDEYRAYGDRQGRFNALLSAEAWLDAAMTLVPEGLEWEVFRWRNAGKVNPWLATGKVHLGSINEPAIEVFAAATPALALCSAALRSAATLARETEAGL